MRTLTGAIDATFASVIQVQIERKNLFLDRR